LILLEGEGGERFRQHEVHIVVIMLLVFGVGVEVDELPRDEPVDKTWHVLDARVEDVAVMRRMAPLDWPVEEGQRAHRAIGVARWCKERR